MPVRPFLHFMLCFLLATSLRPAAAQDGESAPQGDVQLSAPDQVCGRSLLMAPYFNTARTGTLRYRLIPTDASHIGMTVDIYAGFRLNSQPGKLWLLTGSAPTRLVEYRDGDVPTPLQAGAVLERTSYFTVFEPPAGSLADLSALANDGELLFGYGLPGGSDASATGSFREMIENNRFHVIWLIGKAPTAEACFIYSRILQRPRSGQSEPLN